MCDSRDVAELVRRLDEVVAGVEVARVLQRQRESARLRVDAEPRRLAYQFASATSNICT